MQALTLAQELIRCPSVTPAEAGALGVLERAVQPLGFRTQRYAFNGHNSPAVENLFASWGTQGPHLAFAGHVDVVPPGDTARWRHDPFAAVIDNGFLYGRGAVDMKSAIAAFVAAAAEVIPQLGCGRISLLITCDEEGPSVNGTAPLLQALTAAGEKFDACVVGEPTSAETFGDMIKIGRRGSLTGTLTVTGTQGHVAYPERADNPVPRLLCLCRALDEAVLDQGTPDFPPSNLEIVSLDVGNPTPNIIPAQASALFNIRFNTRYSGQTLQQAIEKICAATGEPFTINFRVGSEPFLTPSGPLPKLLAQAVTAETGRAPVLSTTGGTSDARFISRYCPVAEFGLLNHTAHHVDECVSVADLAALTKIYARFLRDWMVAHA
jgi:succinyl-diaminopimelate desuccinylase